MRKGFFDNTIDFVIFLLISSWYFITFLVFLMFKKLLTISSIAALTICTSSAFAQTYFSAYEASRGDAPAPKTVLAGRCTPNHPYGIAFRGGKVNQHIDPVTRCRVTDDDGESGGRSDQQRGKRVSRVDPSKTYGWDWGNRPLEYCKKFYPRTVAFKEFAVESFDGWKAARNQGNYNRGGLITLECIQPTTKVEFKTRDNIYPVVQIITTRTGSLEVVSTGITVNTGIILVPVLSGRSETGILSVFTGITINTGIIITPYLSGRSETGTVSLTTGVLVATGIIPERFKKPDLVITGLILNPSIYSQSPNICDNELNFELTTKNIGNSSMNISFSGSSPLLWMQCKIRNLSGSNTGRSNRNTLIMTWAPAVLVPGQSFVTDFSLPIPQQAGMFEVNCIINSWGITTPELTFLNNSGTFVFLVEWPDLVISTWSLTIQYASPAVLRLQVTWYNQGNWPACKGTGTLSVSCYSSGTSPLSSNNPTVISWMTTFNPWWTLGFYALNFNVPYTWLAISGTITCQIDPFNYFQETDENNNTMQFNYQLTGTTSGGWGGGGSTGSTWNLVDFRFSNISSQNPQFNSCLQTGNFYIWFVPLNSWAQISTSWGQTVLWLVCHVGYCPVWQLCAIWSNWSTNWYIRWPWQTFNYWNLPTYLNSWLYYGAQFTLDLTWAVPWTLTVQCFMNTWSSIVYQEQSNNTLNNRGVSNFIFPSCSWNNGYGYGYGYNNKVGYGFGYGWQTPAYFYLEKPLVLISKSVYEKVKSIKILPKLPKNFKVENLFTGIMRKSMKKEILADAEYRKKTVKKAFEGLRRWLVKDYERVVKTTSR